MNKYKPVIGLEIHVELKTKNKMFCQCKADWFGKEPNTNICPVCLGLPGALPVPNKQAVEWTIKIGQALNCKINKHTKFDRKHYYYPDLPKGYQISQYDEPIAVNGELVILSKAKNPVTNQRDPSDLPQDDNKKTFRIRRVHLEEDTGKLIHSGNDSLVDFNRSSVPLVEIVTEPDFDNPEDIKIFLEELHTIMRYLDVSDVNMEEGSMRLEPNISLKRPEDKGFPPYKVEVKNINSFSFAKKATEFELKRQAAILDKGEIPPQETRGYDSDKGVTYSQRSKEEAQDYRYFPEPDIPPMEFTDEQLVEISKSIPELPHQKLDRFMNDYQIKYEDAFFLTRNVRLAKFYEDVIEEIKKQNFKVKNYEQKIANMIVNKKVSNDLSVDKFSAQVINELTPRATDVEELDEVIKQVITNHANVVDDYKSGKENAIMFLVGQVMRAMKGQADARLVQEELRKKLSS